MMDGSFIARASGWPVANAAATQMRVIHALVLRETMSRYGQHKLGFLWALIEPVLMVTLLSIIMTYFRATNPGGMDNVVFLVSGFLPFLVFRNLMMQLQGAIQNNIALLGFPQVTTFDVVAARALLECVVGGVVLVFMLLMLKLLGFSYTIENPLGALVVYALLCTAGLGIGFTFAAVSPLIPSVRQFTTVAFGRPLFLTSGVFFSASMIPMPYRDYVLYNPILHVTELFRTELFWEFDSPYGDWSYLTYWSVGLLAFGLIVHKALRRRTIIGL